MKVGGFILLLTGISILTGHLQIFGYFIFLSIPSPAVITTAISLLSILIEEYGLPLLQRWLDDHRPDEDDKVMDYNVVAARQATDENIETDDTPKLQYD